MRSIATILILGWTAALLSGEGSMPTVVHEKGFSVVGIEVRTSNAKEVTNKAVIGKEWQKFFEESILQKIPNKLDGNIYAVYSGYDSDRDGEYSLLIGAKVPEGADVPAGLVLRKVVAGTYAVVTSEKGPVARVVVAAWQHVWGMEDHDLLGGPRAYKTDYELYDRRATNPESSEVDLHIGLK
jgi:predicted transcriptional regulator YdeE